jgi:hypothetical protein
VPRTGPAQQIVLDGVLGHRVEVRRGHRQLDAHLARELLLLALQALGAAQQVDRTVLGGGHQPGARVVRDA